ncbi:MAG: ferredoxin family protein [Candidatus Riflebacteria bacterium]|nr:ferredoxin family protein [Candidatus Riflebacteria bacterium]
MNFKRIVICCCSDYCRVSAEIVRKIFHRAESAEIKVELCPDLCFEAVSNSEYIKQLSDENTIIAACHERSVKALFESADVKAPAILDLINPDADLNILTKSRDENNNTKNITRNCTEKKSDEGIKDLILPEYKHEWKAWYPLIDRTRCNGCGKCIDYCLFGVYSRKEKRVAVTKPSECKTNCPACARVCPQQAIIFPKHSEPPINGGKIEPDVSQNSENLSEDKAEDLYSKLAKRRQALRKEPLIKD